MNDNTLPAAAGRTSWIGRLRFPQKLALLSLVFVVPAIVAIAFLIRFTQQQVDFTEKEKVGSAVIAPLGDLALTVQRHAAAAVLATTTATPRAQEIGTLRKRAEDDIAKIDDWMKRNGTAWGMADDWKAFTSEWARLQRASPDAAIAAQAHAAQISRLSLLVARASDVSNITLDPEMAAYMMGNTAVNNISAANINHHRARNGALAGLFAGEFTPEARTRLQNSETLLADAVARSRSDIDKAIAAQPSVKLSMDAPMRRTEAAQATFAGKLDALLAAPPSPEQRLSRGDQMHAAADDVMSALVDLHGAAVKELDRQLDIRLENLNRERAIVVGACITALAFALLLAYSISRRLIGDVSRITRTVNEVNQGNFAARVRLGTGDEIGNLANAFDTLLDQRVTSLQSSERENEQLNNSVIDIMTSVAQLAQRDLNVKVPVSENVTGAVSDAINMMTRATATALNRVASISRTVSESSDRVSFRATEVLSLAGESGRQARAASGELAQTADALREVGDMAQRAGRDAERAIATTGDALSVVRETVGGIVGARDRIQEVEQRMKRLSDITREVSGAVNLIEEIADRTSVLALTASMQAVAAGESGRGFAVVADEVKRLAQSAHDATGRIAGMVTSIQNETTETVSALNQTVVHVMDISQLAESAGTRMNDTRLATETLAGSVHEITKTMRAQGEASQRLLERAQQLMDASERTLSEIEQQRADAENLNNSAVELVQTVSEFRLPAA